MFLLGTVQALNMPARMALMADLVERKDIMNAVALHTMVNQTGQIIGPAVAGGIIELVGIGPTLMVNACSTEGLMGPPRQPVYQMTFACDRSSTSL